MPAVFFIASFPQQDTFNSRPGCGALRPMGFFTKGHKWSIGANQFHLDKASPFNMINQKNFRQFAINSLTRNKPSDLHYCATYGLSAKSYQTIRDWLLSFIGAANKEVLVSKEEQAACMTIDFISL